MALGIAEYKVVFGTAAAVKIPFGKKPNISIEQKVNEMIKEGWTPIGGVGGYASTYHQAMVKYVQIPDTK